MWLRRSASLTWIDFVFFLLPINNILCSCYCSFSICSVGCYFNYIVLFILFHECTVSYSPRRFCEWLNKQFQLFAYFCHTIKVQNMKRCVDVVRDRKNSTAVLWHVTARKMSFFHINDVNYSSVSTNALCLILAFHLDRNELLSKYGGCPLFSFCFAFFFQFGFRHEANDVKMPHTQWKEW